MPRSVPTVDPILLNAQQQGKNKHTHTDKRSLNVLHLIENVLKLTATAQTAAAKTKKRFIYSDLCSESNVAQFNLKHELKAFSSPVNLR